MWPAAYCLARRIRRAVSATVSLTAPMPGGQGCPGGDGRVAERDAQVSVAGLVPVVVSAAVVSAAVCGSAVVAAGGRGREGDVAAQGVADGGVAELGEGGQGGVPADRVPGARLGLVPAEHVFPRFERFFHRPPAACDGDEIGHGGRLVFRGPAQVERQVARPGEQAADQQDMPRAGGGGQRPVRVSGPLGAVPARAALEDRVPGGVFGLDHRAGRQGDAEVPRDDRDVGQARGLARPAEGAAAPVDFIKRCPPGSAGRPSAGAPAGLQLAAAWSCVPAVRGCPRPGAAPGPSPTARA